MSAPGKPITAWHITSADNLGGILTDGFTAVFGNYFSADMNNAAKFIGLRAMTNPETKWVVFQIDTKGVNLEPGNDHSPAFFGTDDSWVAMDPVPADKIINVYEIDFGKVGA